MIKINARLNSVFTTLFYQVQVHALPNLPSESTFAASNLGVTPLVLPQTLMNPYTSLSSSGALSHMSLSNLSDKLLMDASEFLNAVYDDMSQINELLTLKDQTLLIEGASMFFRGFKVVNSLESIYLNALIRVCNLNDLFERASSAPEETIIDYFYLNTKNTLAKRDHLLNS